MDLDTISARGRASRVLRLCVLLATLAALSASPAIAAPQRRACAGAHTRLGLISHDATDAAVVCLVNVRRGAYGLPALRADRRLDASAQRWTNTMVRDRLFSHGADFAARITAAGFRWSRVGENIADGFTTPAAVVAAWMRSPGHCENILDPRFREVGTGFDRGAAEAGTRAGTWTLDLGLGFSEHARSANFGPSDGCPHQ